MIARGESMAKILVKYMHCGSKEVIKFGANPKGKQRFRCKRCEKTFQGEYLRQGAKPETKTLVLNMSVNGSGIRDISCVLGISTDAVISVLKKRQNGLST